MEEIAEEDAIKVEELKAVDSSDAKKNESISDEKCQLFDLESLYEELEQGYNKAIEEMREQGDDLMKLFTQYKRMWEVLYLYHENEKNLLKKNEKLQEEISANACRQEEALKISEIDKQTIGELKKEIESLRKVIDAAHSREHAAYETIENLRKQVTRFSKDFSKKGHYGEGESDDPNKVAKEKLLKERDLLLKEVSVLKERLGNATTYQEELERKTSAADVLNQQLMEELGNKSTEIAKESLAKERLELELKSIMEQLRNKEAELASATKELHETQQSLKEYETIVKGKETSYEKSAQEIQMKTRKVIDLQQEYNLLLRDRDKLNTQLTNKTAEVKRKEDEINRLQTEIKRGIQSQERCNNKFQQIEKKLSDLQAENDQLHLEIKTLTLQVNTERRQTDACNREIENLKREADILNKNITKLTISIKKQDQNIKTQEQLKVNLEQVIEDCRMDTSKQNNVISTLQKERDRYITQSSELSQTIYDTMDEMKTKHMELYECKKKIVESDSKLKEQQEAFEAVRTDRNALRKTFLETQDEVSELRQKLKLMTHQIEQLKEDISTKENQIIKDGLVLQREARERENLKVELQRTKEEARKFREEIKELRKEENNLQKIIQKIEVDNKKFQKDVEEVRNERDILGMKLVRQNDEISILNGKIKIIEGTLERGEEQYEQRLEDIRLLKLEITKLRQENNILLQSIANIEDLKQTVYNLERDLVKERIRCRALEEELQTPMNIHRWRKLEGSDPKSHELQEKIQLLQKRIITQNVLAVEREAKLQKTEKLYQNLRRVLERQPGPETIEKIRRMQKTLQEREREIEGLKTELDIYKTREIACKYDMEKVEEEMRDVKIKYLKLKSQEQKRKQAAVPVIEPPKNNKPKFMGGGFNFSAVPRKLQLDEINRCVC